MPAFSVSSRTIFSVLLTLAVSAAGGGIAMLLGLPAGWLMGGALAVTIAAMAGAPMLLPDGLRNVVFVLIGMSMGASVAPDSLQLLGSWPISLAALAIELVIIVATTGWMLTKVFKLDPGTAYLSSFPGHLSFVMGIARDRHWQCAADRHHSGYPHIDADDCRADRRRIPADRPFRDASRIGVLEPAAIDPAGRGMWSPPGWFSCGSRCRPAWCWAPWRRRQRPSWAGFTPRQCRPPLVIATFVLTGALIGSRFVGITRGEFMAAAKGGLIATAMTVSIVTVMALGVAQLVDMPFGQIWLGLSPGALEGMGALGIALGL